MKPEEIELLTVLAKYPKLMEENIELMIYVIKHFGDICKEVVDKMGQIFGAMGVVINTALAPFFETEEKKDVDENKNL